MKAGAWSDVKVVSSLLKTAAGMGSLVLKTVGGLNVLSLGLGDVKPTSVLVVAWFCVQTESQLTRSSAAISTQTLSVLILAQSLIVESPLRIEPAKVRNANASTARRLASASRGYG